MFALIITVISLGLVVALSSATLFYGGEAWTRASVRAASLAIVNQGQQLIEASELYFVHEGHWAPNVQALVSGGYLTAVPQALGAISDAGSFALVQTAQAAPELAAWGSVAGATPHYWVRSAVSREVCQAVNQRVRGDNGILNAATADHGTQCYGTGEPFTVLSFKSDAPGFPSLADTLPTGEFAADGNGWAVEPGQQGAQQDGGLEDGPSSPDPEPEPEPPVDGGVVLSASMDAAVIAPNGDFGDTGLGTATRYIDVHLHNQSGQSISGVVASVSGASEFTVGTTCGTVSPGQSCLVRVFHEGTQVGLDEGVLSISYTGAQGGAAVTLPFKANVRPGEFEVSSQLGAFAEPEVNFMAVSVSEGAKYLRFYVRNTGIGALTVTTTLTGAGTSIRMRPNLCGRADAPKLLQPGETCEISVEFDPSSAGLVRKTLTIAHDNPEQASPVMFDIAGQGY